MRSRFTPRSLAWLVLGLLASAAGQAQAIPMDFDFSGTFTYDNDVVGLNFTVDNASTVTVFSSSWLEGDPPHGFDPILAIWDMDNGGALIAEQDDGGYAGQTMSNNVVYDHGVWDSWYQVNLNPGNYRATITQFSNFANGPFLSDGFFYDGVPNRDFTFQNGFGGATQPYFNGVWDDNDGRTGSWEFHLLGVDQASVNPIPEPTSLALIGMGVAGALGYGFIRRRRQV